MAIWLFYDDHGWDDIVIVKADTEAEARAYAGGTRAGVRQLDAEEDGEVFRHSCPYDSYPPPPGD